MKFVYGMCIGNFPGPTKFKSARAFTVPLHVGDNIKDGENLVAVKSILHDSDGRSYAFCEVIK